MFLQRSPCFFSVFSPILTQNVIMCYVSRFGIIATKLLLANAQMFWTFIFWCQNALFYFPWPWVNAAPKHFSKTKAFCCLFTLVYIGIFPL